MKQKRPESLPLRGRANGPDWKEAREALILSTGAEYKSYKNLSADKKAYLRVLSKYYAYSHNGYVLLEALETCKGFNPPAWVLRALDDGFAAFRKGKSLSRALHLGKRDREEFDQFKAQGPTMKKMYEYMQRGNSVQKAAALFAGTLTAEALEKQYHRFWKDFFEYAVKK